MNRQFISILLVFLIGCTANCVLHGVEQIPNMYIYVLTLFCALSLKRTDLKVFIILVTLECFVGFYEYYMGISSVLPGSEVVSFQETELLYFKRVSGLSVGTSTYSQKILYSAVFLISIKSQFPLKYKSAILIILCLGLYTTFNRTAIGVLLVYLIITSYKSFKSLIHNYRIIGCLTILILIISIYVLTNEFGEDIVNQFTRGGHTDTMLTGRPYIWGQFAMFIRENPLIGNGSAHYFVPDVTGVEQHAHNSYIQLIADHGIILSAIYLLNIGLKINKTNRVILLPFFLTSFTQYVIFWGYSVADVFFLAILCNRPLLTAKIAQLSDTYEVRRITPF